MESKEVDLRSKALMKATAEKQPSSTIIKLLDELRTGVQATEELLRATRVGVNVGRLRQHPDPAVAKFANELVSKWRTDVRKTAGGASTPKSTNGTSSPAPGQTPSATPKPKAKHNVPGAKRNTQTDHVDWQVTENKTRNNCIKLMYDGLAFMSDELPDDVLKVARQVELAAYNAYQPETSEAYKSKMRSLYQNLKNKGNPQLRVDVLNGTIAPKRFVVMTHDELKSKERREEDAKLEKENMRVAMTAKEEKSISTTLQCSKCKAKKVSYSQAQTRSADEPMTTFCECLNCGNRWKFS